MAKSLFSRPGLPPTVEKLMNSELNKFWSSVSYYLSRQLAFHQAVSIPGLGTFTVVREYVASQQKGLVVVERPVFLLEKALARDCDLQYDSIVAGHDPSQQLPYAEIASENGISEGAARLCVERSVCHFGAHIDKRCNVALVWWDVGMLLIEGNRVQMKFYEDFLEKLNGTADALQALLGMPEMSKSVISRNDCAASQTTSGRVTVFPMYKHETVIKMTEPAKVDLKYHMKTRQERGWARPGDRGRKGDLCETRLLHRAALSPKRLTVVPGRDQKAEEKEPRTRQLPAILRRSLQEKEQEKVIPLVAPRMVDFVALEIERRRVALQEKREWRSKNGKQEKGTKVREEKGKKEKQEKKKVKQEKNKFPKYIQQFLDEQEKKNKMLQKERKQQNKQQEKKKQTKQNKAEVKETEAKPKEVEMPAAQESSASEEEHFSSLSETKMQESSPDLMERMMGEREEAEEEPLSISWDSAAFPKRSLSPRTDEVLREVVQCIVGQVAREQQGQRDAEKDLQERLQSELAVLRWSRRVTKAPSVLHLLGDGHRPAPPAGPRPGKGAQVRRVVPVHVDRDHERSASAESAKRDIQPASPNSSTRTTFHCW